MIDWAEVNFIIGTNPDNFIEIKFDQKSIDTELGLNAYMNPLIKTHEVIAQFQLRRVIKFWGYKDGTHVYYMLAPPWIKFNPGITYASILNQLLDDEERKQREAEGRETPVEGGHSTEMDQNDQNYFKIHQMVFKKSNFIKEPQLYSKNIEV